MHVKVTRREVEPPFEPVNVEIRLETANELKALKEFAYFTGTIPAAFRDELDKDAILSDTERVLYVNIVGNTLRELYYNLSPLTKRK